MTRRVLLTAIVLVLAVLLLWVCATALLAAGDPDSVEGALPVHVVGCCLEEWPGPEGLVGFTAPLTYSSSCWERCREDAYPLIL